MIKACFFDVDGTLVSHTQGAVPQKTKKGLEQLRKKGIKIFLSTGRHMEELDRLPVKGMVFDEANCGFWAAMFWMSKRSTLCK